MNYVYGHRNLFYVPDMVARNTQVYSEIELQSQAPAKIWLNFAKLVSDYAPIKLKKFLGNAGVVPSLKNGTTPKHEVFKQFLRCCNMKCCNNFNFWPFICRVRIGINIMYLFNLQILAKSDNCLLSANTSWHMHMANICSWVLNEAIPSPNTLPRICRCAMRS